MELGYGPNGFVYIWTPIQMQYISGKPNVTSCHASDLYPR